MYMKSIGSLTYHIEGLTPGLPVNWEYCRTLHVLLYKKIACVALPQNLLSWSDEALAPLEAETNACYSTNIFVKVSRDLPRSGELGKKTPF